MLTDGRLSVGEFRAVVWSEIEGWKRAKQLRITLICLGVFAVLVLGANIAMAVTVASKSAMRASIHFDPLSCINRCMWGC